jgi:predicted GH43/DUF377 family glycosyl hydrolase
VDKKLYLIYNDNTTVINPTDKQRRDMYLTELVQKDDHFHAGKTVKLTHKDKYSTTKWQKNWVPFEWNKTLLVAYSINPHEILYPDLSTGESESIFETTFPGNWWMWGHLRGGTPALSVDGEYLAFFHSAIPTVSSSTDGKVMHHYYMGAYTFSAHPPFNITKVSPFPIVARGFYTKSTTPKRVIFPGGFVVDGPYIHIAYGKDDHEVWILTLDKAKLLKSLRPV